MKRTSTAVLASLGYLATLMLSAAVAGAITLVNCTGSNPCEGTEGVDEIMGTEGFDEIYAYGAGDDVTAGDGADKVYGGPGGDQVLGDYSASGSDFAGGDEIYGEDGGDYLYGGGGSNQISGGPGNDYIDVEQHGGVDVPGEDTVRAGGGNDEIEAADGLRDVINCGGGKKDRVIYDKGLDTVTKCERKRAL
jgi:Ca2+-binding RTX toxin-like protein